MSMGSLILAGGAPGKRQALPNSRILIHQPHGGYQGQTTDIAIHAREAQFLRRRIEEIYAEHTGPSRSSRSARTWSATASSRPDEAVEYGLIDRVFVDRNGNGNGPGRPRAERAGGRYRGLSARSTCDRGDAEHEARGDGGRAERRVQRVGGALGELERDVADA